MLPAVLYHPSGLPYFHIKIHSHDQLEAIYEIKRFNTGSFYQLDLFHQVDFEQAVI
jgi:hypothetical protein